jgi:hypothetical protein
MSKRHFSCPNDDPKSQFHPFCLNYPFIENNIKGIGIVTCLYVNPELNKFWLIDYRIFAPDEDGKTKLDRAKEMFDLAIDSKQISFRAVLMDTWYATCALMMHIERNGKIYYCPLQDNRQVDEGGGATINYQPVDSLSSTPEKELSGKNVHVKDFPKGHRLQLFRLVVSKDRTDYVVTNDLTQNSTDDTQKVCVIRWRIEQLHREVKQITGLESCQCRKGRIRAQSHRLCHASLVSFQRTSLRNRGNSLSNQVRSIERLLDSATQISLCQNGFCVSPIINQVFTETVKSLTCGANLSCYVGQIKGLRKL